MPLTMYRFWSKIGVMISAFPKATEYLVSLKVESADPLDKKAYQLLHDEVAYERASQALRRRFVRGAELVDGVDRGGRLTKIKRTPYGKSYRYVVQGSDGNWSQPDERLWVVTMYALWQDSK